MMKGSVPAANSGEGEDGGKKATITRYLHTVRYLRPTQIWYRLLYSVYRPRVRHDIQLPKRTRVSQFVEPCRGPVTMTGETEFVFLNKTGRISRPEDWNTPTHSKLWLYNLHYFDDLNAIGAEGRLVWHKRLIGRWIKDNPPYNGNGWEPYPLSRRVVNWIKWDIWTGELGEMPLQSLAGQIRWLRRRLEYHILGNHLLANAKALIYGGLYFSGEEPREWTKTGLKIFNRQLELQVLGDGGHFELSPMYHLLVLEDILDVINIWKCYGRSVPQGWRDIVERMLRWADIMKHPDGDIPFFNDATFSVASTLDTLQQYTVRLQERQGNTNNCLPLVYLPDSGYSRLGHSQAVVFFDVAQVGPKYLPGHGHADTLSVEASVFGHRVLVNSGTSLYEPGRERMRQRGTEAHNTITINGQDSSEVWSSFRVARRANCRVNNIDPENLSIVAEHDGYRRLKGCPRHIREVQLSKTRLTITDSVESSTSERYSIKGAWHLHPDINVAQVGKTSSDCFVLKLGVKIPCGDVKTIILKIEGEVDVRVEACTWHPGFGCKVSNKRIVFEYNGLVPLRVRSTFIWKQQ